MFKQIVILCGILLTSVIVNGQDKIYRNLSVSEFNEKLNSTSGEVLLDLRTPDEIKKGKIPGAVELDYFDKTFESKVANLDRNKTYFVYCQGGGRSGETLELMQKLGFKEVYNLPEGFAQWQQQKMPVEHSPKK